MPDSASPSNDVTQLLVNWSQGDPKALGALTPLVYDDLRRLAGRYLPIKPSSVTGPVLDFSLTTNQGKLMAITSLPKPDPVIEAYKKNVDRTLLRENLRLTAQQRFENLMRLQRFATELRKAGHSARKNQ